MKENIHPFSVSMLEEAIEIVKDLNLSYENLKELVERFSEGKLHLAVLGQFKRGKSTFINAIIGKKILPSSVIPLTAIPTFLSFGKEPSVKIVFENDKPDKIISNIEVENIKSVIEEYVTEEKNPENKLQVNHVEVFLPEEIFKKGIILIDTPGIGSTFTHNTETTLNFLPQCDAAFFVVSTDPPITEVEVEFLKEVSKKVPRIFFILNKIDYLDEEELKTALEFFKKMLEERLKIKNAEIYPVSAKYALSGKIKESRMDKLFDAIDVFIKEEKDNTLQKAILIKFKDNLEQIILQINLIIRSLTMPVEELNEKIEIFQGKIDEVKQEIIISQDLLKGDQKRLLEKLDKEADILEKKAFEYFFEKIKDDLENGEKILEESIPIYFEKEFGNFTRNFNKLVSDTLRKHQERADKLISSIREHAANIFDIPYTAPESVGVFELKQKPYWVKSKWYSPLLNSIFDSLKESLLPGPLKKKVKMKKLKEHLSQIISNNIANIHWSILQSINDSFRSFSSSLNERLEETVNATKGAIETAIEKRKQQGEKVKEEVEKYNKALERLKEIMSKISY